MNTFFHKLAAPLGAIMILAGCSPIAELTTFIESEKVCQTIDAETISSIIGEPNTTTAMEDLDHRTGGCGFSNSEDDPHFARNFNIIARKTETPEIATDEFRRAVSFWKNNELANKEFQDIEALGTDAFWVFGANTSQIITYQDDIFIIISFAHLEDTNPELLEKAKNLAATALEKTAADTAHFNKEA